MVSILGDGGIGETASALQVCYDLVRLQGCPFGAVVWVTGKSAQLTFNEIVRIETAVEDSLGLFASATSAVGGLGEHKTAIDDLLNMLGAFPTLVVLENVETVLDDRFPDLLRNSPRDSKVLITSRIGVKTENPLHLSGLSVDDSKKLMRILARVRGFDLGALATDGDLADWSKNFQSRPGMRRRWPESKSARTSQTATTHSAASRSFWTDSVTAPSLLEVFARVPGLECPPRPRRRRRRRKSASASRRSISSNSRRCRRRLTLKPAWSSPRATDPNMRGATAWCSATGARIESCAARRWRTVAPRARLIPVEHARAGARCPFCTPTGTAVGCATLAPTVLAETDPGAAALGCPRTQRMDGWVRLRRRPQQPAQPFSHQSPTRPDCSAGG